MSEPGQTARPGHPNGPADTAVVLPDADSRIPGTKESRAHPSDWLLWQLADSSFPTGGFAHSGGIEAAWQHGEVRSRDELVSFLEASLRQAGSAALPFVAAAHAEPSRLLELDRLCQAFTTNHIANRASRAQGKAWLVSVERTFPPASRLTPAERPPFAHLAPVFGFVLRRLEVSRETAARLFVFHHLRGLLAAAVRLNIVGPMEAQALQHRLAPRAEAVVQEGLDAALDDVAQTAPLLELWQATQDRLYSRLFQS